MGKNNILVSIILIIVMIVIPVSIGIGGVINSFTDNIDENYAIPLINMDLYVNNDGSIHVIETDEYSFSGTFHGVHRYIPLSGTQKLENINVSTQGAYNDFNPDTDAIDQGDQDKITVDLYSNRGLTAPVTNTMVNVTYQYDMSPVIKFYSDTAELQYQLVGTEWPVNIGHVNANVHVNSSQGVQYWVSPPYYDQSSGWNANTLQITGNTIPSGQFFEVRMTIPKNQFNSTTNGIIINQNGLSTINSIQNNYLSQVKFYSGLYTALAVLLIVGCFIPLILHFRFGRDPKIDYKAEYERDLPTDDLPAIVNAFYGPGSIGDPSKDGFKATIMDLIDRKYLLFEHDPDDEKNLYFKVNTNKDLSTLNGFERDIIDKLDDPESDVSNTLEKSMGEFVEEGENQDELDIQNALDQSKLISMKDRRLYKSYYAWRDNISKILTKDEVNKKYNAIGSRYLNYFAGIGFIIALIIYSVSSFSTLPAASLTHLSSIIFGVIAIVSVFIPRRYVGHWTTAASAEDNAKWQNFKKYINDFSLMKEYPPESVKIWNKYLVYATALGAADAVRKAMEFHLPQEQLNDSDIYMFNYYGGSALLSEAVV